MYVGMWAHIYGNLRARMVLSYVRPWSPALKNFQCHKILPPYFAKKAPPLIKNKVYTHTHSLKGFMNYVIKYQISKYSVACTNKSCYTCNKNR